MADDYRPESSVKTAVANFLKKYVPGYSFHYSAYYGVPGIPDRILVQDGRFIGIELKKTPKTPKAKIQMPSKVQEACHKELRKQGAVVIVVNEPDPLAQLERELRDNGIKVTKV